MIQPRYSNSELLEIAQESYEKIIDFGKVLCQEGYWSEPESYLKIDILEMIDLYLQSILMNLYAYCGENGETQRKFMLDLIPGNALGCPKEGELPDEVISKAGKILNMPPIIIQLCGLRDSREDSFYSSDFLDALFNVLIAASLLDNKQSKYADKFIVETYEKLAMFMNEDQISHVVNTRYIFYKLSSEKFAQEKAPVDQLKEFRKKELEEKREVEEKQKKLEEIEHKKEEAKKYIEKKKIVNVSKKKTGIEQLQSKSEQIKHSDEALKSENEQIAENTQNEVITDGNVSEPVSTENAENVQNEVSSENSAIENEQKETKEQSEISTESNEVESNQNEPVKQENHQDKPVIKTEKKSVFDYSDEELMELQKKGKLKIKMPRMERLKLERERAIQKIQDEKVEKIRQEINKINHAKELQNLLDELNGLVGLAEVKLEIQSLINLIKVKKMRESYNMPSMDVSYHMVFTGNPGTGKTTVARLVAKIYQELGILSKGHLVEVDRAGLVAGYVGQTAIKVKEVVDKAIGGILFIDEAYSLTNKNDANDFGGEAIDTLVKMMEDHRDNLVIIVAGYKNEMDEFLKANTGLISRFNKFIDFADYTNDELFEILKLNTDKAGLVIEEDAEKELRKDIEAMTEERKFLFGNGRGMRNTFESILGKQADRIVTLEYPSKDELVKIKYEDVVGIISY